MSLTIAMIVSSLSDVSRKALFHRPARFERCQDRVQVHRSAPEDLISQSVRKSIQDSAATRADWRFADATRADRSFRIGDVQRFPFHVDWQIENRGRLIVVESLRQSNAVVLIIDPLLPYGVADAERRAPEDLSA